MSGLLSRDGKLHPYEPAWDWAQLDTKLGLPDNAGLVRLAERINAARETSRGLDAVKSDHREIGLCGERQFARVFRLHMDTGVHKWGNQRKNFRLANGATVDVVTRRPPRNLSLPDLILPVKAQGRADLLCLCVFHGWKFEPELWGWVTDEKLKAGPTKQWRLAWPLNYVYPGGLMEPMHSLLAMHRPDDPDSEPTAARVLRETATKPTTGQLNFFGEVARERS